MELSRRRLLQAGLFGVGGALVTSACSSGSSSGTPAAAQSSGAASSSSGAASSAGGAASQTSQAAKDLALSLWYWGGGLSDKVVAAAATQFPSYHLKSQQIGGDFKQKLLTTMTGGKGVPDITGIKGEDMASFYPQASSFVDLNTLGAAKLASGFLPWKWQNGASPDGKQIGYPIDIGPTALFYRQDVFKQAGLPFEPADVAAAVADWEAYFQLGVKLKEKIPGTFLVSTLSSVFDMTIGAQKQFFVDKDNKFIGDQEHIQTAWKTSVRPVALGIDAKINDGTPEWNAGLTKGTLASQLGAAWHALDISSASKESSGKWRVAANPGGPANIGGSFLAIPKSTKNPEAAFEVIQWILNPENQARGFTDDALFPSSPASYKMPALTQGDPYFGGQVTIDVFGPQAEKIPVSYTSPFDSALRAPFYTELGNVESSGKNPDKAWADAVGAAKTIARRLGVSV